MTDDELVAAYLKQLSRAARQLPRSRRNELVDEIAAHIAEARAGAAPLRDVIDVLGEPEEIVAAAGGQPASRAGAMEIIAVVLLLIGGFLFLIGWVVGLVLLWASPRWRWPDKLLGTLVWPGGLAGVIFVGLIGASSGTITQCSGGSGMITQCTGGGGVPAWVTILILVVAVVSPFAVAIRLLSRARRVPDQAEPRLLEGVVG